MSLLLLFAIPLLLHAQHSAPLKLIQSIPLPGLKEGDFVYFAVMDRNQHSITAKWPIPGEAQQNLPLLLDESNHRLLLTTRKLPKLVVIDSDTGKVTASVPCVGMVDDIAYGAKLKRVYLSGDQFVEVFKQEDADYYRSLGKIASGFRAKTAIFVPELNRYFLAMPRHDNREAEVRVYETSP